MGNFASSHVNDDWAWVWAIRECEALQLDASPAALPAEILPHLLISDFKNASDLQTLAELRVTHVLNVAGVCCAQVDYASVGIEFATLEADDEEGYQMVKIHLAAALAFVGRARDAGGRCVVHCVAGLNRSGVLVAAIAMLSEDEHVLDVVRRCRAKRGRNFLSNHSFQEQLVALARAEGLLGLRPGDAMSVLPAAPTTANPHPRRNPSLNARDALNRLAF